jgi:hypothetical protein
MNMADAFVAVTSIEANQESLTGNDKHSEFIKRLNLERP